MVADFINVISSTPPLIFVVNTAHFNSTGYANSPLNPDPTDIDANSWGAAVRRVCDKFPSHEVVLLNPQANGYNENTMAGADGIHYNALGAAFMADFMTDAFRRHTWKVGWKA